MSGDSIAKVQQAVHTCEPNSPQALCLHGIVDRHA